MDQARRRLDRPRPRRHRPAWPLAELTAAIDRAHELGARVTAHVFGEDALPDLIAAGIDCIEHGTGMSPDIIHTMAERKIALVPTLINIARFPEIAGGRQPLPDVRQATCGRCIARSTNDRTTPTKQACRSTPAPMRAARSCTDASPTKCLRCAASACPASTRSAPRHGSARDWLGVADGLSEGSHANFVVYDADPLVNITALQRPAHIVLKGSLVSP